jgi:hypothetical protein
MRWSTHRKSIEVFAGGVLLYGCLVFLVPLSWGERPIEEKIDTEQVCFEIVDVHGKPVSGKEITVFWQKPFSPSLWPWDLKYLDPYEPLPPPKFSKEKVLSDDKGQVIVDWRENRPCSIAIKDDLLGNISVRLERRSSKTSFRLERFWTIRISHPSKEGLTDTFIRESDAFVLDAEEILHVPVVIIPVDWYEPLPFGSRTQEMLLKSWCHGQAVDCRNLDGLRMIPWMGEVCKRDPSVRDSALGALLDVAVILGEFDERVRDVLKNYRDHPQFYPVESISFLKKWSGFADDESPSFEEIIQRTKTRIQSYTLQVIDAVLPYVVDHEAPVHALGKLGALGRPAIPRLQNAWQKADSRRRLQLSHTLWLFKPDWEEVRWFVQNKDPETFLAGFNAAKDFMKISDVPVALELIQQLVPALNDERMKREANSIVSTLKYRMKWEGGRVAPAKD